LPTTAFAQVEKRPALLIGNQGYSSQIGKLTNPDNDIAGNAIHLWCSTLATVALAGQKPGAGLATPPSSMPDVRPMPPLAAEVSATAPSEAPTAPPPLSPRR
jgi:hypothetical protein